MVMDIEKLQECVEHAAAIRRVRRLQPVGGAGDKLFPPTYPGEGKKPARHVLEMRRIDGETVQCVLIDSVQSQANRLEEALLKAERCGRIALPYVEVDFAKCDGVDDIGKITSLDAPHRIFDAIIRDSEIDGQKFWEHQAEAGRRLEHVKPRNATPLFELSPTALVFGAWNSTGKMGGLGEKFTRCIVSEIVGINAVRGARTGSRMDPLGISKNVKIYQRQDDEEEWTTDEEEAAKDDSGKPKLYPAPRGKKHGRASLINHSNVPPSVDELGVTVDCAQQTTVITLAGLRRLSFPGNDDKQSSHERDRAARTVLAALALVAIIEQDRQGYALRSRCDLVPEAGQSSGFEIVLADGATEDLELEPDTAVTLLKKAIEKAKEEGLEWIEKPLSLEPQERLIELVRKSRGQNLADEDEGEGE